MWRWHGFVRFVRLNLNLKSQEAHKLQADSASTKSVNHPGGMKSCSLWLNPRQRVTPPDQRPIRIRHPGGMKGCSRWLNQRQRVTPPDQRLTRIPHPGGMPALRLWGSIQVFRIIRHPGFFQEPHQFLPERLHTVVLLLDCDVALDGFLGGGADGERRVALLPLESGKF